MVISIETIVVYTVVGAAAGWLAALLMRRRGFGLLGNLLIGIAGAFLAGWLLTLIGVRIAGGYAGLAVQAFIGAVLLVGLLNLLRR